MPLFINTNIAALNSQRYLQRSQHGIATSMERLSSGQRINSAADDAAGLTISNRSRAKLGAVSNRLNFTINNLMNVQENTVAARSRIMDTDFAHETAMLSRNNILAQVAQSMLAQANAQPSLVLSLLRNF